MNYDTYRRLRLLDHPALQAYSEAKGKEAKRNAMDLATSLGDMLCGLVVFTIATEVIRRGFIFKDTPLWITSPSGKTTMALPLPIAFRVIRKREWDFAKVEPVRPPRVITRRQAMRILIFGDKSNHKGTVG